MVCGIINPGVVFFALVLIMCIILLILLMVLGTIFARKLAYRYATPKKRLKIDVELIKKYLKTLE